MSISFLIILFIHHEMAYFMHTFVFELSYQAFFSTAR